MLKCLPGARVSGDGTLHASAQHLLENVMRIQNIQKNLEISGFKVTDISPRARAPKAAAGALGVVRW